MDHMTPHHLWYEKLLKFDLKWYEKKNNYNQLQGLNRKNRKNPSIVLNWGNGVFLKNN